MPISPIVRLPYMTTLAQRIEEAFCRRGGRVERRAGGAGQAKGWREVTGLKISDVRGALTRIKEAFENEQRYYQALRAAGIGIADVAERLQSGEVNPEGASLELLEVAKGILVAMRVSIPEDGGDET